MPQHTPSTRTMHPRLERLDDLATSLADNPGVAAVLGLGSAGTEYDRFDDNSDIDFFLIVDDPTVKARYLAGVEWLTAMGDVVYEFVNDANGRKALFDDGLFVEYAVFTVEELTRIPAKGVRIIWRRPDFGLDTTTPAPSIDSIEFHLNEALTNLFVGLHRELRGERLTAGRFIQVFAIDRILALNRLSHPGQPPHRDPFDPTRRVETAYPEMTDPLEQMLPGYGRNAQAARAVLGWLTAHFATDPVITASISTLINDVERRPDNGIGHALGS